MMEDKLKTLISLIKDKKVFLATHWDADGVCSGALLYHLIKPHVKEIATISKGEVFRIREEDVGEVEKWDYIICSDIQPDLTLDPEKTIYIDHHPHPDPGMFAYSLHDSEEVSATTVIWKELLQETDNAYFIFLVLMGYFGDSGDRESIPEKLFNKAKEHMPELMIKRKSYYNGGEYLEMEKYTSMMNIGKRMHWNGEVPLALLKDVDSHHQFVSGRHPLFIEMQGFKQILRKEYSKNVDLKDIGYMYYGLIESTMNVQGVLCARHMKDKPIMIINKYNGNAIASMRVPDELEFDAGSFLEGFTTKIESLVGGGHEKAGGVTLAHDDLDQFLQLIHEYEE